MIALQNRRILLGITGGIAAYKSAELVRRLREAGAEVQVVMTAGGQRFVTPLTFQALSGNPVRTELLDESAEAGMGHIELARWADLIVVAPASANFLSRLVHGAADDLLATVCLATEAPVAVVPAMNQQMWANAATQSNMGTLQERNVSIWGPGVGEQACGETGAGRMLEPAEILAKVGLHFGAGELQGKRLLITAGPTREAIDPVRYITNRSSGRMGYAIAEAAAAAGAEVILVSGPVNLPVPAGVERISVESASEMHGVVLERAVETDVFVACAAVADYRVAEQSDCKIKKSAEEMGIRLERNADILADVAERFPGIFTLGFAAETDDLKTYARGKREKKKLNMIAANWVGEDRGFDREDNALWLNWVDENGEQEAELGPAPKKVLARELVKRLAEQLRQNRQTSKQQTG